MTCIMEIIKRINIGPKCKNYIKKLQYMKFKSCKYKYSKLIGFKMYRKIGFREAEKKQKVGVGVF